MVVVHPGNAILGTRPSLAKEAGRVFFFQDEIDRMRQYLSIHIGFITDFITPGFV